MTHFTYINSADADQLQEQPETQPVLNSIPGNEHQWSALIEQHTKAQKQPTPFIWTGKVLQTVNRVSTKAAGKLAYKLWFTPQNRPMSEADKNWLNDASKTTLDYQGMAVPVYSWGEGKTILTVHGWGGHSGQFRQLTQALVDQGYQVISFDAPGHGHAEGKTTNAVEISEIIQIIAEQQPLHGIISHSIGGLSSHHALNAGTKTNFHAALNTPLCLAHIVTAFKHQLALPSETIDQLNALMEERFGKGFWSTFDLRKSGHDVARLFSYDSEDHQVNDQTGPSLVHHYPDSHYVPTTGLGHNKAVRDQDVIQSILGFIRQQNKTA